MLRTIEKYRLRELNILELGRANGHVNTVADGISLGYIEALADLKSWILGEEL